MIVRVTCFARIREIVGSGQLERALPEGANASDCFRALAADFPALADLGLSTRFVRDGAFVGAATALRDGDELGLLPPYGGG
jgi:molybdopterin converting factor small subunit